MAILTGDLGNTARSRRTLYSRPTDTWQHRQDAVSTEDIVSGDVVGATNEMVVTATARDDRVVLYAYDVADGAQRWRQRGRLFDCRREWSVRMVPHVGFGERSSPARWTYVFVGGGVALPCTAFSYWQTGSEVSLGAVAFGGILTGYLLPRSNGNPGRAGVPVGIVGGFPILWAVLDTYPVTAAFTEPVWFEVAGVVFLIGFTIAGFGITALVGEAGVRIGAWLAGSPSDRHERSTEPQEESRSDGERHGSWFLAIVLAVQPLLTTASLFVWASPGTSFQGAFLRLPENPMISMFFDDLIR